MFIFRKSGIAVLVCVSLVALLLGILRVEHLEQMQVDDWQSLYGTEVLISGKVIGDIEQRESSSRFVVEIQTLKTEHGEILHPDGSVLLYEPYPTMCVTGEEMSATIRLQEPEDFLTEANRIFRYKQYLRLFDIYATSFIRESGCVGNSEHTDIFAALRKRFMEAIHSVLPVQEASLLGGLLLGLRGSLSDEIMEIFRVTGLIHIIVLSGYNITLVAEAVRRVFARTPRMMSLIMSLITIIAFVLLAGAQTAAVRAGSMATIALIARANFREYDGVRILLLVGALMVLYNPDQILFSTSFHMSFLATLGLLIFSPAFENMLTGITERFQIRNIIAATLSTQIFLLPYLAYSIGEVSIIGFLANILVLPLVPVAMALGALLIVIAIIAPFAAAAVAPAAYLPLAAIIWIADMLAVPFAVFTLPKISAVTMLIAVAVLAYVGLKNSKDSREKSYSNKHLYSNDDG